MHTCPVYDICQYQLLSLPGISKISRLRVHLEFYRFPQITNNTQNDISMPLYKSIVQKLVSMPNLSNLTIIMHQKYFFVEQRGTPEISTLLVGFFEPLKQIKVHGRDASFEVCIDWSLSENEARSLGYCPFQIIGSGDRGT